MSITFDITFFTDLKKEVAELTKQENELKSEKVDIDQNMKVLNGKMNEHKGSIHSLEVKIANLKLQEIPNESPTELTKYSHEQLDEMDIENIQKEIDLAEKHIRIAKPNLRAIEVSKCSISPIHIRIGFTKSTSS